MSDKAIILLRVQSSECALDFCEAGHYDDLPNVAKFISSVLDFEIERRIDGPSERVWSFKNSTLKLLNNPYGTTLIGADWSYLHFLVILLNQYTKNKKTVV